MRPFRSYRAFCALSYFATPLFAQSAAGKLTNQPQVLSSEARRLFTQATVSRGAAGVGALVWDDALAKAALQHGLAASKL